MSDAARPFDRLDAELPRSVAFLVAVRDGRKDADIATRVSAARFLVERAPLFMRLAADIERAKFAPVPLEEARKTIIRTAIPAPHADVGEATEDVE